MAEIKTVSTLLTPSSFTFPETPPPSFFDPNVVTGTGTYSGFTGYSYPFTASRNNPSQNFYRVSNYESTPSNRYYGRYAFDQEIFKELQKTGGLNKDIRFGEWSVFGKDGVNPEGYWINQIDDFKQSGAIRGTSQFAGNAFFNRGFPDEQYRASAEHGAPWDNTRNAYIEITPEFINNVKSGNNPLYTGFEPTMASGQYQTLNPRQRYNVRWNEIPNGVVDYPTSFWDRINPANRQGVRVVETRPASLGHDTVQRFENRPNSVGQVVGRNSTGQYIVPSGQYSSPYYTTNPETTVLYDTITPIKERTLGQHWRNLQWNVDTILSQPEVKPYWSLAKAGTNMAVKTAGMVAYAGGVAHNGPVQTAVEFGVPFTPLKYGIGPVLTANAPEKDPYAFERKNDPLFGLTPEERLQRSRTERMLQNYDSYGTIREDIENFSNPILGK